jgi:hypothetical protein
VRHRRLEQNPLVPGPLSHGRILLSFACHPDDHIFHTWLLPLAVGFAQSTRSCDLFSLSIPLYCGMGEMKRAIALEQRESQKMNRFASTLVIAAAIIAAVRLARDDISNRSQV